MTSFIAFGEAGLFDESMQDPDVTAFETPLMRAGKQVEAQICEKGTRAAGLAPMSKGAATAGSPAYARWGSMCLRR